MAIFVFFVLLLVALPGSWATGNETAPECKDVDPGCAQLESNCKIPLFEPVMKEKCNKTCGFCIDATATTKETPKSCEDSNARCIYWRRNNFCRNKYYTDEVKKMHCAKTCDMC